MNLSNRSLLSFETWGFLIIVSGFFVNNQFRLIVEGTPAGSDNLEEVFEANLRRTGHVVAVLDTWHQPTYLRRVRLGWIFN